MNRPISERRPLLLLVFLLSILLILLSSQVRTAEGRSLLGDTLLSVTGPVVRAVSGGSGFLVGIWDSYIDLRGTRTQNRELLARVSRLEERERRAAEIELENQRLRLLLGFRERLEPRSLAAEVLTFGFSGQSRNAVIDRGGQDGVRLNMPVVNRQGLVGKVHRVGRNVAQVQLFIDPNSGVAAVVQRTRVQGVVIGMGTEGCRMAFVSDQSDVEVGDVVVTSGIDQIYPPGLTVGVVSRVEEGDQLTKNVSVQPEVDFGKLEEVLVLLVPDTQREEVESLR